MNQRRRAALVVSVHLAGLLLAVWAGNPPAAAEGGSPAAYSPAQAADVLRTLMGDGRPRPIGSDANATARARIVGAFEALGYQAEVQTRFVCGPFRRYCAEVHNVVARLETGAGERGAVLVNAHYDSMAATPGAADCLAGVAAVIESARALRAAPPARDVIFLINDGEEAGLLGATAFVEAHPWAADVRAVVNLEARGSGGPSWPVYTSGPDRALLAHYLAAADRPAPGSLAPALTRLLPLANDLTVFQRLGVPGVTIGFARHPRRYHTPRDDVGHLSAATFAQHGRQALGLVRRLAADPGGDGDPGTFAAVGSVGLAWPLSWARPLAGAAAMLVLWFGIGGVRGRGVRPPQIALGLAAFPLLVLVAFFGAACLNIPRRAFTEIVSANVSNPLPSFVGFALWGFALVHGAGGWLGRRAGAAALWLGTWTWWAALGVALAWLAPLAGYLTLLPVLAAGLAAAAVRGDTGWRPVARFAVPGCVAAAVWYPHLVMILDLAGVGNLPPVAGLAAIVATTTAPLLEGRWGRGVWALAAVLGLALVGIGTRVATFTADDPQFANLSYTLDADSSRASWTFTGSPLPASLRRAAGFGAWRRPLEFAPQDAGFQAPAPMMSLAPPRLDGVQTTVVGEGLRVEARLVSARGARIAQLVFPAAGAPERVTVAGVVVPADAAPFPLFDADFRVFTIWTLPPEGLAVTLEFSRSDPAAVTLVDRSDGLPAAGEVLLAARPDWSTPVGPGDQTIVRRRVVVRP
ncbi:MAG: M20/M25/M40 family metallo-hydrolase [Gemmatimonadales bacterium]